MFLLLLYTYLLVDLSYFLLLIPMCVKVYSRHYHPGSFIKGRSHIVVPLLNPLTAELNPISHLLALLRGATIVVVSRLRVKRILVLVSSLQSELF